ncbi:MAG: TonB-dependent receptor [Myxococcales bacterium]|nr:TonB-dependent receptor [Myxococcales bacterium]HRC54476.1 TonB-dependent receptor [Kofleriaceae bacterium]
MTADDGEPIVAADVTLLHVPSGNEKTVQTNETGDFAFTGLRVGGPYRVSVLSLGFAPFSEDKIMLTAGKTRDMNVALKLTEEIINIVVTNTPRNASAKTVVAAEDIGELPSIGRDPKDVVRLTPGAYAEGRDKALSIDGTNNRFNSVTVDGTRQDDDFGLNASGYPTRRSPVALSAVEEVAVESSPFDVRYGKFLGGNVNIVTKTGTNEFHGQVIGTFANDSLVGNKSRDNELKVDFREARFGATVGGPIIKDKVHFLASVEGLSATTPVDAGPAGSDAANITSKVTLAEMEEAQAIAREVYGFEAGDPARSVDESDLKLLAKVDWAINQQHRLSVSYQRTSGNAIQNTGASDTILPLSSNWYDAKDTLNTVAARLFSDWSDKFSTELEVSGKLVANRQKSLNGTDFAAVTIRTPLAGQILLGPDEFRHANELDNDVYHGRAQGNLLLGNHLITGGAEYDYLAIDNLFVAGSRGVADYASLANFRNKIPTSIRYNNALSHNPTDAAADWNTSVIAGYLQDQFEVTPDLTVQAGVRLEGYHASLNIAANPNFQRRYGFSNTSTIDGKNILLPRLGLSYRALPRLNLRGGVGLYSGGTPTVWVSNSYTNDGVRVDTATTSDAAIITGFDGRTIPDALKRQLVVGDGNIDAIDPNFRIPSTWKVGTGADYSFDIPGLGKTGENVELKLNYTYSKVRDAIFWRDLRRNLDTIANNNPTDVLPDGRPYYDHVAAGGQFNPNRGYDMFLDNTSGGRSHAASIAISKKFPFGLSLAGSYAYTDAQEVSPATSSRSVSNYGLAAVVDPQKPDVARSNYERTHRFMGVMQFSRAIIKDIWPCCTRPWEDMRTTVSLFFEGRSGQPFSYTFADNAGGNNLARIFGEEREFARRNRQLFYVPKGDGSDVILMGIDQADFDKFLKDRGLDKYKGQIAPRNAFTSSWLNRFDMRISQDLPSPVAGHRARFVLDIENLGNLLNDDWGRYTQVGFPFTVPAVDVNYNAAERKYVYSNLRTLKPQRVDVLQSVWRMSMGLIYDF